MSNLNTREIDLEKTPKNRQELKKLGLLDRLIINSENSFIDENLSNNRDIQRNYLDIVNKGTFRKPSERKITKKLVVKKDFNNSSFLGFKNKEILKEK